MIRRTVTTLALGAALLAASATVPLAQSEDPINARQEVMKTVGRSSKTIGDMLKGTTPFDAAAANAALVAMQEDVATFGEYFPEGSETGGETEAAPAIWSDRAGFETTLAAFQEDIDAAVAAAPQDQAALQAAFAEVGSNCRTCHQTYRVDK